MHADPNTSLPLTVENLERKREGFGISLDGSCGGAAATPRRFYAPDNSAAVGGGVVPSDFIMIGKFKTTVNEVLTCLGAPGNTFDIEDYIAVTEECLQALKTLKVERRIESRRANNTRVGNPSASVTPAFGLPSPAANDDDCNNNLSPSNNAGERSSTPAPTTYMAALLMKKRGSPKPPPPYRVGEVLSREEVEAARHAATLRSEERQRLAEERRMDRLQEMKLKSEAAEARELRVKARREEAEMRQRAEAEDRLENSRRRAEEARKQTVEKAQKSHARVDEVRLSSELRQQTKTMAVDKKMSDAEHNQETMKEAQQTRTQEKSDAMEAAAERRQAAHEERVERQKEKEQQWQDKLRRVDEQRRAEQEQRRQNSEEAERGLQRRKKDAAAEAEAATKKNEEKMQQSAQVAEEQREKRRQKQERQDQKGKEAKNRRDDEADPESEGGRPAAPSHNGGSGNNNNSQNSHTPLQDLMPHFLQTSASPQEEEQMWQRVNKLVSASARQGKAFTDTYQKESLCALKDLNRSKLRPAFSRLSAAVMSPPTSGTAAAQCKQPLNDLLTTPLAESDHEFVRYFNQFEVLVKVVAEARKTAGEGGAASVVQQATDLLLLLFIDEAEGKSNVTYFVRSGGIVSLIMCIREEMKTARRQYDVLRWMLSVVGVCLERLSKEPAQSKTASVRDQLLSDLDVLGLDRICLAVVKMPNPQEEDLELVYCALCVLNIELGVYCKRKNDLRPLWFQNTVAAFFALLQNVLTPGGVPVSRITAEPLSCGRVTVLFCVFRTLNMLARWQLVAFQTLLHDTPTVTASASTTGATTWRTSQHQQDGAGAKGGGSNPSSAPPIQITRHELFHVLNSFFLYIQDHTDELEAIPVLAVPAEVGAGGGGSWETGSGPNSNKIIAGGTGSGEAGQPCGASMPSLSITGSLQPNLTFADAVKYGLTLGELPAFPPTAMTGGQSAAGRAGSGQSSSGAREGFQPGGRHYPLRATLHECLLLVGYLCLDDNALQEMMSWGEKKSLLGNMLNVLPAQYFSNAQHILFPTVLAAVGDNDRNMRVAMTEMEPSLLHAFVTSEFNALSKGAKAYAQEHGRQILQYKIETDPKHAVRHSISKSKATNWADMVDDDSMLENRTSHSTETTSTTPAMEKEKLSKIFRTPGATTPQSYPCFFKIDRRLPITYWPSIIEQLEQVLQNK